MKFFYQKYIVVENLITELHSLDLSDGEKHHLASLADSSLHHAILDEILSNLNENDKKQFLHELNKNPENEKLMEFLKERVDNIEDKIKTVSDQIVKEMHKDIKEAKNIK
jgi:uncharacterized protein YPO0396